MRFPPYGAANMITDDLVCCFRVVCVVNIAMAAARVSMSRVALDGWFAAGFIVVEL